MFLSSATDNVTARCSLAFKQFLGINEDLTNMYSGEHTHHQFDRELESVRSRVLSMGGLVERQIGDALTALKDQNIELAEYVIRTDHRINALEVGIDEDCTYILARRQPAAGDLRTVMSIIKTITDLERIGDESEKIAKMVLGSPLNQVPGATALIEDIEAMGSKVSEMLRAALDGFVRLDVQAAFNTASMDVEIDSAYGALLSKIHQKIKSAPDEIEFFQRLIWITRSLERIGDHSKNICEYVVYLARGKDVRHISIEEGRKEIQLDG